MPSDTAAWVVRPDPSAEYLTVERCSILELLNVAEDPAVSIAQARVAPGVQTVPHRVAGTVERYVIVRGCGRIAIDGLPEQEVQPGDVVVIPAGTRQSICNTGSADLVFLCVCTPRFEWSNYESLDD
ncbi:MAG: cupin domain-containing protein [Gammaproteobacteria bacterium]|jgi:mannose-6-phosphate isomerase-like protein (cupin superfamily)|nr:cupin domain-containing protein [Gammaproteobacteria bacterium]